MQFRRLFSLVFVFYMVFLSWLPLMMFRSHQNIIRKEVKTMIKNGVPEHKRLVFFAEDLEADHDNLTWIHEKEFRYRGEMYDILKREYHDGKLVYVCIHDVKESGLFRNLDELVDRQMQHHSPLRTQTRQLISFFQGFCIEKPTGLVFYPEETERIGIPYSLTICLFLALPETPPPELCIVCLS